jgi:hypothetical protein
MIPKGQGQQQEKLPSFMFVSKIAKISNDKYYINIPKASGLMYNSTNRSSS